LREGRGTWEPRARRHFGLQRRLRSGWLFSCPPTLRRETRTLRSLTGRKCGGPMEGIPGEKIGRPRAARVVRTIDPAKHQGIGGNNASCRVAGGDPCRSVEPAEAKSPPRCPSRVPRDGGASHFMMTTKTHYATAVSLGQCRKRVHATHPLVLYRIRPSLCCASPTHSQTDYLHTQVTRVTSRVSRVAWETQLRGDVTLVTRFTKAAADLMAATPSGATEANT